MSVHSSLITNTAGGLNESPADGGFMFRPYASGSGGNFYEVYDGASRVMLECGLPRETMSDLCDRPLTDYQACLISHEHKDHARAAAFMYKVGIPIFASAGTLRRLDLIGLPAARELPTLPARAIVAGYKVFSVPAVHDALEPTAFLIRSLTTKRQLFFAVDAMILKHTVANCHEIAVECNYDEDSLPSFNLEQSRRERLQATHMSLERVLKWLSKCNLAMTERIWLLHISGEHGNPEGYAARVSDVTGIDAVAVPARAGRM